MSHGSEGIVRPTGGHLRPIKGIAIGVVIGVDVEHLFQLRDRIACYFSRKERRRRIAPNELPGVAEAIVLLKRTGFSIIVVSNQRCIAKGLLTIKELDSLNGRIWEQLASAGASIDGAYYCPHNTEPPCECRKPKPGMLLDAARINGIALSESWMIGDSDSDVEAGREAGCKTVRILDRGQVPLQAADLNAYSLLDAAKKIVRCRS